METTRKPALGNPFTDHHSGDTLCDTQIVKPQPADNRTPEIHPKPVPPGNTDTSRIYTAPDTLNQIAPVIEDILNNLSVNSDSKNRSGCFTPSMSRNHASFMTPMECIQKAITDLKSGVESINEPPEVVAMNWITAAACGNEQQLKVLLANKDQCLKWLKKQGG